MEGKLVSIKDLAALLRQLAVENADGSTKEVLTATDLAALMGYKPSTIRNKRSRGEWLPPACEFGDARHPLWLRSTVLEALKAWERPSKGRPARRSSK